MVPGVSAIKDMMPKPAIVKWAASQAAEYAVSHLRSINALVNDKQRDEAVQLITEAYQRYMRKTGNRGTRVHTAIERLIAGERRFQVSSEVLAYLRHYARFVKEWKFTPIESERVVWSFEHEYAGRLDSIAQITVPEPRTDKQAECLRASYLTPGEKLRALVDFKTGQSGIWEDTALQQVAYAKGDYIVLEDGTQRELPKIEHAFALWLRPDGWALHMLDIGESTWAQFLRCRDTYHWKRGDAKRAVYKAVNARPLRRQWSGK